MIDVLTLTLEQGDAVGWSLAVHTVKLVMAAAVVLVGFAVLKEMTR